MSGFYGNDYAAESLRKMSPSEVETAYRRGLVKMVDLVAYAREWNSGPHFSQLVFMDDAFRLFDPESGPQSVFYRHLFKEFGVTGTPEPLLVKWRALGWDV